MGKSKKKSLEKRQKKEARELKIKDSIDEIIQRVVDAHRDSGAETPSQRDLGKPSGRAGPSISQNPSGNRDPLSQGLGELLENSPSIGDYKEDAVVDEGVGQILHFNPLISLLNDYTHAKNTGNL